MIMLTDYEKKFLKDNESLLKENNLTEVYKKLNELSSPRLTQIFESLHINPLEYMNYVPYGYDNGNSNLLEIEIPNNIITINGEAFANCSNLRKVIIPNSVSIISDAFRNCSKLKEVKLGDGVNQLIESFYGCTNLKSINLPEGLEYIDDYAFYNCISLKELKLPKSLKYISAKAFPPKLNELIIPSNTNLSISLVGKKTTKKPW